MKIIRKGKAFFNKNFLELTVFPDHGRGKNRDYVGLRNLVGVTVEGDKNTKQIRRFDGKEVVVKIEIEKAKK